MKKLIMKKVLLLTIALLLSTSSFAQPDALAMKKKLKALGYYSGAINGAFDAGLRSALGRFMNDMKACPANVNFDTCGLLLGFQRKSNKT